MSPVRVNLLNPHAPGVQSHGRPRVAEFVVTRDTGRRVGELVAHVERETGALWLFAVGPSGGDRGKVIIPTSLATRLLRYLGDGEHAYCFGGTVGSLRIAGTAVTIGGKGRGWAADFGDAADELRAMLRQWAQHAIRDAMREDA